MLYGPELRQTTMDNFVSVSKYVFPVVNIEIEKKNLNQSSILKYLKCKK